MPACAPCIIRVCWVSANCVVAASAAAACSHGCVLQRIHICHLHRYDYQCVICGELLKKGSGSTDKLIRHFGSFAKSGPYKSEHSESFDDIHRNSSHTKRRFGDDGKELERAYSFSEALPHHVRFCLWIAANLRYYRTSIAAEPLIDRTKQFTVVVLYNFRLAISHIVIGMQTNHYCHCWILIIRCYKL